jgi:phospho-N-acetylmuramoyl-pentapeptide-transferase
MLYHFFEPLQEIVSGFRLFEYVTFRAAFAAILAFLVSTVVGPGIVESLRRRKIAGYSATGSTDVDARRMAKAGVPTMGGVILLIGVALSGLLFARLDTPFTWIALVAFLAFGALGAVDDWKKLTVPGSRGMSERGKLIGQVAIAVGAIASIYAFGVAESGEPWLRGPRLERSPYGGFAVVQEGDTWARIAQRHGGRASRGPELVRANGGSEAVPPPGTRVRLPSTWTDTSDRHRADLQVPFVKGFSLDLGLLLVPLGVLVIVGASNAVNLTDGLDGLAIGVNVTVAGAFAVVAYIVGRTDFSRELHLFYVPEGGELAIVAAALAGGSLGFLWFNAHPAQVFMGDTGALSIGGILGVLAVMLRHELTLFLAGGVFVAEALSVIWQRAWFKGTRRAARRRGDPNATGRRWFRCAPLHHHYEQGGLHENKVTVRLWIVSMICAVAALASLKMR